MGGRELSEVESEKRFFGTKSWALLHDPPHKMWALFGTVRIASGGHEDEALKVWEELRLEPTFGNPQEYQRLVQVADDMASTSDRWITNFAFAGVQRIFKYDKLHNIFNPELSINIRELEKQGLRGFLSTLAQRLAALGGDPRRTYHALYALYEVMWAANGLPPSLADTRAPTHTLFDHVYATALTLNILWPDGKVGGYAAIIDIPGIQQLVGAARKTGDFWVGSWMVSLTTWLTLWPLVWEFGADILLKPSPRFNPYYHAFTWARLGGGDDLECSFMKFYSSLYPQLPAEALRFSEVIRHPVIPGTACLVVPRERPSGQRVDAESLEEEVRKNFEKAYEVLGKIASGNLRRLEEPYDALRLILGGCEGEVGPVVKLFGVIQSSQPQAFEGLLRARIAVVDIGRLYGEWLRVVKGEEIAEVRGEVARILKALAAARSDLAKKLGIDEEKLAERLTWQALFALLYSALSERASRKLVPPKAWFKVDRGRLAPIANFEAFYDRGGVGYLNCSTCGSEPAILKLSKEVKEPGLVEYGGSAKELLKLLELSGDIEGLRVSIKPGEALGPLCLTKRALYAYVKKCLDLEFDSTEDVAFGFIGEKLRGFLTDYLRGLGGEASKVAHYLEEAVKSFEDLNANAERARAVYESVLTRAMRELAQKKPEEAQRLIRDISSELASIYGVRDLQLPESFFVTFRGYYCILKADADNVGDLSRGRIPSQSYLKLLDHLREEAEKRELKDLAEAFTRAKDIVEILLEKLRSGLSSQQEDREHPQSNRETMGFLLPSPAYSLALSTALMTTALKSSMTLVYKLKGVPVFSGGDDDLALLPAEMGLAAVGLLRGAYHGEKGFHRVGGCFVPAPVVYGKSFSLRFVSILDVMSDEIAECVRLLDEAAKEAVWMHDAGEVRKDSLALSDSRGGRVALLPLSDGRRALRVLELMWLSQLCGFLSANLPEDFTAVREAVERAIETNGWDLSLSIFKRLLRRNVQRGGLGMEYLSELERLLEELVRQKWRGLAPLRYDEFSEEVGLSILSWVVEALRVVRRYP